MGILDVFRRRKNQSDNLIQLYDIYSRALSSRKTKAVTKHYRTVLTNSQKRDIYRIEPILFKGINKKARDLFSEWFDIDSPIDGVDVPENIEQKIKQFNREINLKQKLMQSYVHAQVYGNAYLELVTTDNGEAREPLKKTAELVDVINIDPETITKIVEKNGEHFFIQTIGGIEHAIHESRIIHIKPYILGDDDFGLSVVEVAYIIAQSKLNTDKAAGEIPYRFSHPFPIINIDNAAQKEIDDAVKVLQKINPKTGFVGSDRYHFDMLNPDAIDLTPFANWFYINLAAALQMPLMILIGVQKGAVTGSEVDLREYYNDIKSIQETIYTPVLDRIYKQLIGDAWKYEIYWRPIYVNQKEESEIRLNHMKSLEILYLKCGIISDDEARQIAREWDIPIPEDVENIEQPGNIEEKKIPAIRQPTTQEFQISKMILEQARRERELGKKLLSEGAAK